MGICLSNREKSDHKRTEYEEGRSHHRISGIADATHFRKRDEQAQKDAVGSSHRSPLDEGSFAQESFTRGQRR